MKTHRLQQLSVAVVATGFVIAVTGCSGHSIEKSSDAAATLLPTTNVGGGATLSNDTGDGAKTGVDVCSLLSAAQASSIIGFTYTSANSAHNMCTYVPGNAPVGMFIIVSSTDTEPWAQAMTTMQEDGGESPSPVSGIGDEAAGAGTEFDVRDGKWIIDVHGGDPAGPTGNFSKSTAVAKAIIAGLH